MNKQKSVIDNNDSDVLNELGFVSISDNNIQQNRVLSNNQHHQNRLLVLQNQSISSSQKGSIERKVDKNDSLEQNILNFQRVNQGIAFTSPKKIKENNHLISIENPNNLEEEVCYYSKNIAGAKSGNQSRHKTPYQRIYVEQQSIQKQSQNNSSCNNNNNNNYNNNTSFGSQSNSQNNNSNLNQNNNYRFNSINRKDQTPKNKISLEENQILKTNNRSAIRDISSDTYNKNTDDYKVNRIYAESLGKQQGNIIKDQLNNILQNQNSSQFKKINVNRHNSQVYAYPSQDSNSHNQSFNIRQIKKKSSVSMGDSQLTGGGGSGTIVAVTGQNSQIFGQNIQRERDGSGGKIIAQNSLCKYDSIRLIQNSQDNSSHNISINNNRNTSSIHQYHPDSQVFQVNIYNNQERQERIQQAYLGPKANLTKKQMSPPKEVMYNQYETIDINNKRKAKSTQRQQSILRERKQNGNTIHFIHNLNQSGGSGGNGSNNNLSLYSLNQNQQINVANNNNNINNQSYESCYASQNANRFYFRSKNNQSSGAQSSQVQSSVAGQLNPQNSSVAAATTRRQLPHIKDAYNTIDNSIINPPSSLYKAKNIIKINGNTVDRNQTNRTLDAYPLSTTSKQEKQNKLATVTINVEKKNNINTTNYYEGNNGFPSANVSTVNTTRVLNKKQNEQNCKQNQQNKTDNSNVASQNKINSRSQSIRRGRIQQPSNTSSHNNTHKMNSQKENVPALLQQQQQQQQILIHTTLQLQSCPHKDDHHSGNRFTNKNDQQKQITSLPQDNTGFNLSDIVDVPVVQKQERLIRFQENLQIQQQQQDERKLKGYNTISIEEQKRCASQTENRPESQVQKEKQNFYKQSCAIEKINHLKSIETGDVIPTTNKINADRNSSNPIYSPLLNRDSSPVPQAHTPTKKRVKNQNQVNQKIEFFPQPPPPQPPPPPPSQNTQQQQNQSKNKYGQIIQKFQRGNLVKPKPQNSNNQQISQQQQIQLLNNENNQSNSTNPNSVGLFNKQTSQMSTNIALSSNQCNDILELKFNSNNQDPRQVSLNVEDVIQPDQNEESMDNLMRSLQDDEGEQETTNQKDSSKNYAHLQSLENSFQNYFTQSHINIKSQTQNENHGKHSSNQKTHFASDQIQENKQYSQEPEKPRIDIHKKLIRKITEKNEDLASPKKEETRNDEFIFSTFDAFTNERRGSKVAKIIIDFDIEDDQDYIVSNNNQKNKQNNTNIENAQQIENQEQITKPIQKETQKIEGSINIQNSQRNLIEEPTDSARNSPQLFKPSAAIKPLYYKYNNSYHQASNGADHVNIELNDLTSNQPTFEKFINNKMSNMRNSYLKSSIRYDNNFINQQQQYQQQL